MTIQTDTREIAPWQPSRFMSERHANRLYSFLLRKAIADIEEERATGSEYPKYGSMSWRACVAERAFQLCENWKGAGDVAGLYITKWIQDQQLFFFHPRQWESVEQMLSDICEDVSDSGRSVYTRLARDILPYLKQQKIAKPEQVAASLMPGKSSARGKWYHMLPLLTEAIAKEPESVPEMVQDILDESKPRTEVVSKWRGELPIPPAQAELRLNGNGVWHLSIDMTEEQKRLIIARLGERIEVREL